MFQHFINAVHFSHNKKHKDVSRLEKRQLNRFESNPKKRRLQIQDEDM